MKRFRLVLLTLCLSGIIPTVRAMDAVLLKPHSAEIVRHGYSLGKRAVHAGETVRVVKVQGESVEIETKDGDPFTVPLKDLRMLSENRPASPEMIATPRPASRPTPVFHSALDEPTTPVVRSERRAVRDPDASSVPVAQANPAFHTLLDEPASAIPGSERRIKAVRCGHITRKGTPCKRMTHSPNGLCAQHGGN